MRSVQTFECSRHVVVNIVHKTYKPNTSKIAIFQSGGHSYSDMFVEDFIGCMLTSSAPQEIRSGRETKTSIVLSLIAGIYLFVELLCAHVASPGHRQRSSKQLIVMLLFS